MKQSILAGLTVLCVQMVGCGPAVSVTPSANASRPGTAPAPPPGRFLLLQVGTLFVPNRWPGTAQDEPDLLVHFHGEPHTVARNFMASGLPGVVLIINYPGLSATYAAPFRGTTLFGQVWADALSRLKAEGILAANARWGRLRVSSFSAGYGAVREILKNPAYFGAIDGLCMLDSIYAGYMGDANARMVEPTHMVDFRRFARAAAGGEKVFVLSHSYLVPGSYASTIETADDLIAHVDGRRHAVDETIDDAPFRIVSRCETGQFHVFGCAGTDGQAHMQHLRYMRCWLARMIASSSENNLATSRPG